MELDSIKELVKIRAELSAEEMEYLCDIAGVGLINFDVKTGILN